MARQILFVLPTAFLGGAERVVFNLVYWLATQPGHHVTVFVMSRGRQVDWAPMEQLAQVTMIYRNYGSEKKFFGLLAVELIKLSFKSRFDLVFSTHAHVNALLSGLKKMHLLKTRYLVARESTMVFERFRGRVWSFLLWVMYRIFYGAQDLIICQTQMMKVSLLNNLPTVTGSVVEVLANPVNVDYALQQSVLPVQKPFKTLLTGCGRLIPLKRFEDLLMAFAQVAPQYPEAGLMLIGEGPEQGRLQALTQQLKLDDQVVFMGRITNPLQWFAQTDIGVIASEVEGFPNVLIEMMAAGTRNVISTPCSDGVLEIPDITVTSGMGVDALTSALTAALARPCDQSSRYQQYIRQHRSVSAYWQAVHEQLK